MVVEDCVRKQRHGENLYICGPESNFVIRHQDELIYRRNREQKAQSRTLF